jgi:hypothetical protein
MTLQLEANSTVADAEMHQLLTAQSLMLKCISF